MGAWHGKPAPCSAVSHTALSEVPESKFPPINQRVLTEEGIRGGLYAAARAYLSVWALPKEEQIPA